MQLPPRGTVSIIEFWATWCGPCRQTIPHLSALATRYAGRAAVVGVSLDDNADAVKRFVDAQRAAIAYAIAVDTSGSAQRDLYLQSGARGVPHAFVLDAGGKVCFSGHPMDPALEQSLVAALQQQQQSHQPPPEPPKRAVPPITETYDELMAKGVRELKALLAERGVAHGDCLEKADLAKRIVERCSRATHYV
jgi:hypothetical protein